MQLVGCQFDIQWENREANFATVRRLLSQVEIEDGALIVLPEMFSSGFSMNVDRVAESVPSETESFLQEVAREYNAWTLGGLVFSSEDGKGSNELSVFDPKGQLVGHYQKNHCFSYTGEDENYESGDDILIFDWQGILVCPSICYDLRFPELYRRGTKAEAELFLVIANWPEARIDHWTTLLRARAIENQGYTLGVNRVGSDPKWNYPGQSVLFDPHGAEIINAGAEERAFTAEIHREVVTEWRESFQAIKDMKF